MIAVKTLHLFPMRINQPLDSLPDMAVFARVVDAYSAPIYRLGLKMLGSQQDAEDGQQYFLRG